MLLRRSAPVLAALTLTILASCAQDEASVMAEAEPAAPETTLDPGVISALTTRQQEAVRALVRDTLIQNPEILLEAQDAFQAQAMRQQNEAVADAFDELKTEAATLSFGPADAPITIIEFFDYRCPFCHQANEWLANVMEQRDDVRVIFKELPILSENSVGAAKAAIAAHKQGKYIAFHQALMTTGGELSLTQVMQIATDVGLDTEKLQQDMASPDVDALIAATNQQATALNMTGTPGFVINGKLINGFNAPELDAALATAGVDAPGDATPG